MCGWFRGLVVIQPQLKSRSFSHKQNKASKNKSSDQSRYRGTEIKRTSPFLFFFNRDVDSFRLLFFAKFTACVLLSKINILQERHFVRATPLCKQRINESKLSPVAKRATWKMFGRCGRRNLRRSFDWDFQACTSRVWSWSFQKRIWHSEKIKERQNGFLNLFF